MKQKNKGDDAGFSHTFGERKFRKLRVSVTDQCNHSCIYCDPGLENVPETEINTTEKYKPIDFFLQPILRLYGAGQMEHVHLTGGEPTLYPYLVELVLALKKNGVALVTMTSNGHLLGKMAPSLKKAGLDGINVSLDSLNPTVYRRINGTGTPSIVMASIEKALEAGLSVKVNSTILRGYNDTEVVPLLEQARKWQLRIRYIEFMAIGPLRFNFQELYFSREEILKSIHERYPITNIDARNSRAARYFQLRDGYRFGVIANTADPFCATCDRLRMDSRGLVYGCLSALDGYPLPSDNGLSRFLERAMAQKNREKFSGTDRSMKEIGG